MGAGEAELDGDGHTVERVCLNCRTALIGDHCHHCGQKAHVHRTLGGFGHDLMHGVLHVEGKIWNTLPLLAWRPGDLTRRYIEGQRARYVSPIALFFFSVFLMFAVVNMISSPPNFTTEVVEQGLANDQAVSAARIKQLEALRARAIATGEPTTAIDSKIDGARKEAEMLKSIAKRGFVRGSMLQIDEDVPEWLAGPVRQTAQNPDLLLYKVQNNAYKFSWALIPMSLPFLWLLFPFSRRFRLYDHMVFVTYSLSFMTLLVVAASLLYAAGLEVMAGFAMLIPPLHIYRQLKGAYGLGRWGALLRTLFLTSFAVIAAGLFVIALFAAGLF